MLPKNPLFRADKKSYYKLFKGWVCAKCCHRGAQILRGLFWCTLLFAQGERLICVVTFWFCCIFLHPSDTPSPACLCCDRNVIPLQRVIITKLPVNQSINQHVRWIREITANSTATEVGHAHSYVILTLGVNLNLQLIVIIINIQPIIIIIIS